MTGFTRPRPVNVELGPRMVRGGKHRHEDVARLALRGCPTLSLTEASRAPARATARPVGSMPSVYVEPCRRIGRGG